jgi:hypothetical protein
MKKILVVFTSVHFPTKLLRFVTKMARENSWMLQAVFVHDQPSELDYPFPNDLRLADDKVPRHVVQQEQNELEDIDAQIFAKACKDGGISYEVRKDVSLKQLLQSGEGADLMIVDRHMEFYTFSLLDLLQDAKCSVCLVSDTPMVENVLLAYDGTDAAKKAITSFLDLFPGLASLNVHLVAVNADEQKLSKDEFVNDLPFSTSGRFQVVHLSGNVKQELENYVKRFEQSSLVVMGGFGRNFFSRISQPSIGRDMLGKTDASMFIAHR